MSSSRRDEVTAVSFNQPVSCLAVASSKGFSIYNCSPFAKSHSEAVGGIGIVEMLFCTSLVALVGGGDRPAFSQRTLRLWNTKTSSSICELSFESPVLAVRMNRQRLVVVLINKIQIFDLETLRVLATLDTVDNPRGLCVLSPNDKASHLVFPSSTTAGELLVYNALSLGVLNVLKAHLKPTTALAISQCGSRLATASETGTIIRVFALPSGEKVVSFRRGSTTASISCLSFFTDPAPAADGAESVATAATTPPSLLCVASHTPTIHVYSFQDADGGAGDEEEGEAVPRPKSSSVWESVVSNAMKLGGVEGDRDFAQVRLRTEGVPWLCGITWEAAPAAGPASGAGGTPAAADAVVTSMSYYVTVVTSDGIVHQYLLDRVKGGECKLAKEFVVHESESEAIGATLLH